MERSRLTALGCCRPRASLRRWARRSCDRSISKRLRAPSTTRHVFSPCSSAPTRSTACTTRLKISSSAGARARERVARGQRRARGLFRTGGERGEVSHLSRGPCLRLAVEVQLDRGERESGAPVRLALVPEVAEQVRHRRGAQQLGRAERQAADGPELLLELARRARVKGEVAGIVRARREFVDEQAAFAREEKLDAHDADHVERLHNGARDLDRLARGRFRDVRGRDREVEYVAAVRVLDDAVVLELARLGARGDDRDLALEVNEGFENPFAPAQGRGPLLHVFGGVQTRLPLAVVTGACGLQDRRVADLFRRRAQRLFGVDVAEARDGEAPAREKVFFAQSVLRRVEHFAGGPDGHELRGGLDRFGGHLLELEGHDRDAARELGNSVEVFIRALVLTVGNLTRGRVGERREGVHAVAHPSRGDGEHAAQLAAAKHTDGRSGQYRAHVGRVASRTFAVCSSRKRRKLSLSSGRVLARTATARRPAFVAPPGPMASVPTGIPAGIWTIDRSESIPFKALLSTGTPKTGTVVCAATIPARCAAPPAPAMITSRPRPSASEANSAIQRGVRCAETTRHSYGTPNRFSTSAACRIVSQSDVLPMMTATKGKDEGGRRKAEVESSFVGFDFFPTCLAFFPVFILAAFILHPCSCR